MTKRVVLYHATSPEAGETIMREGFRDHRGRYGTDRDYEGVWLSNRPLDCNEHGRVRPDDIHLAVELPAPLLEQWADRECIEAEKTYREWCIPAAFINEAVLNGTARIMSAEPDEFPQEKPKNLRQARAQLRRLHTVGRPAKPQGGRVGDKSLTDS